MNSPYVGIGVVWRVDDCVVLLAVESKLEVADSDELNGVERDSGDDVNGGEADGRVCLLVDESKVGIAED